MRFFLRCDASAQERAENVASLRAVPASAFSADPQLAESARAGLIALAEAGHECYAYQPASGEHDRWIIWLRSGDPAHDDRWPPERWAAFWAWKGEQDTEDAEGGQNRA